MLFVGIGVGSFYGKDWLISVSPIMKYQEFQWSLDYLLVALKLNLNHEVIKDIRFYKGGPGLSVSCWVEDNYTYQQIYAIFEDIKVILESEEFITHELFQNDTSLDNPRLYQINFIKLSNGQYIYEAMSSYKCKIIDKELRYMKTQDWILNEYKPLD